MAGARDIGPGISGAPLGSIDGLSRVFQSLSCRPPSDTRHDAKGCQLSHEVPSSSVMRLMIALGVRSLTEHDPSPVFLR